MFDWVKIMGKIFDLMCNYRIDVDVTPGMNMARWYKIKLKKDK